MPTTYTHDRFGTDVLAAMPEDDRIRISDDLDLFMIGLQGPDILFYYKPFVKNKIVALGHFLHDQPGRYFFGNAARRLFSGSCPPGEAELSYICGCLAHYALDVVCHPDIVAFEQSSGVTHAEIEGEFDRYLLVTDGYDPVRAVLTGNFHPSGRAAKAIAPFYKGVTERGILKSLDGFISFNKIVRAPGKAKRAFLNGALRAVGKYDSFHGHIINLAPNPLCEESNRILMGRYEEALPVAVDLIHRFLDTKGRDVNTDDFYDYDFLGIPRDGQEGK